VLIMATASVRCCVLIVVWSFEMLLLSSMDLSPFKHDRLGKILVRLGLAWQYLVIIVWIRWFLLLFCVILRECSWLFFFKCFLAVVQEERKCLEFSANERDSFLICECNISCTCFMICSHDCALSKLFLVVILCNVLFKMIIENLIKKSC
jgi:hypothetical protein